MKWLARGEDSLPAGSAWLTEVEARRAASARFTKRRTEYLLRRLAGKCAVAATIGLPEDVHTLGRIAVLNEPTGAPFVQVDGRRLDLDISLTDRAGWAVCLVGADLSAVGCDLEIVEPRSAAFVADFFTPDEQQAVGARPAGEPRDAMANLVWSAKESALKVLRTGLRADTRSVEVTVTDAGGEPSRSDGWHPLAVTTGLGRLPGWWRRDGVFLLTVVHGQGTTDPPTELAGSAPLAAATPINSWLATPVVGQPGSTG